MTEDNRTRNSSNNGRLWVCKTGKDLPILNFTCNVKKRKANLCDVECVFGGWLVRGTYSAKDLSSCLLSEDTLKISSMYLL